MEKRSRNTLIIIIIIKTKSRVSDQNGVSLLYIMLEIHHSGLQTEGFGPEWCISTIYHAWDTPFWPANWGFWTRMVYLFYTSCLRYIILVGNPRNSKKNIGNLLFRVITIISSSSSCTSSSSYSSSSGSGGGSGGGGSRNNSSMRKANNLLLHLLNCVLCKGVCVTKTNVELVRGCTQEVTIFYPSSVSVTGLILSKICLCCDWFSPRFINTVFWTGCAI